MARARDIRVAPVSRWAADECVRRWHYSGKPYGKSQLHLGVFIGDQLLGAMAFGQPLDPRKVLPLVRDTPWNGMMELNRMAFADALPRNSESRALGVALRMIRTHAQHVQWVISFADATRCGDGTIYRASGFMLTGIKPNKSLLRAPDGAVVSDVGIRTSDTLLARYRTDGSAASLRARGFVPLPGYQLRYIYPLRADVRARLTVPVLPYDAIPSGARMYRGTLRGETSSRVFQDAEGGATPTSPLQSPWPDLRS